MVGAGKAFFKKPVIMLGDHSFSINIEGWQARIAAEKGGLELKLLHGT